MKSVISIIGTQSSRSSFRGALFCIFAVLRFFGHHMLELGPQPLDLTELVANLSSKRSAQRISQAANDSYSNHSFETSVQLVDVLEHIL